LFTGSFTVQVSASQANWLHLADASGKIILKQNLVMGKNIINAENLSQGVYIYTIGNYDGGTTTGKIIKQ
jgi:hypothetical protein